MIKIISDSTGYIPGEFIKEHDIRIIPLHVLYMDSEFDEGLPGTYDAFFESFVETKVFPKTSQPSLESFVNAFNEVIDNGDEAIVFTISSTLSGCYSVANLARNECKDPSKISIIDSGSCGQVVCGYAMEVVDAIKEGKSRQEIVDYIERLKERSSIAFVPDSLEYLKRGGRIGKVSATLGTLLQIKPILTFTKGVLACAKKLIGVNKAIAELFSMIPNNFKRLFVIHIAKTKNYGLLKEKVVTKFPNIEPVEGEMGPVIAAHIGPAIGVCWIAE